MERLAGDAAVAGLRKLSGRLAPFPGRADFAIRLCLICALTALDVEIFKIPEPALTIYVCFFVLKPDRVGSVVNSIVMLVLVTVIIGLVLVMTMAVIDQPLWRVTLITLASFGLLFVASASKLKPVGGIIALIVGYALAQLGTVQIGEIATRALLYGWLFVAIPAAISILINLLIGPAPRRLVERNLAYRLRLTAAVLRENGSKDRTAFYDVMHQGLGDIPEWLRLAGLERTSSVADLSAMSQAARSTCALLGLVDVIVRTADAAAEHGRVALASCLEDMAAVFQCGGYPVDISVELPTDVNAMPATAKAFSEIHCLLKGYSTAPDVEPQRASVERDGFFASDAFINPIHVQYALKTTAAALFCYCAYTLLDWPGIHTCFITCYIVSLGTAAETIEKLTLRIVGCLIGAAAGVMAILWMTPNLTSIGELLAVVGVAALPCGWIAAGGPRISYVGFQIAFAFFLCVVQGSGPQFDLTIARDRVIGVLFGDLVVALVFTQIWPITVARRIDPAIASLLRKLATLTTEGVDWKRWALTAEIQAGLGSLEQDVRLLGYEPRAIRPSHQWIEGRANLLAALNDCSGALLLVARPDHWLSRVAADALDELAAMILNDPRSAAKDRDTTPWPREPIRGQKDGLAEVVQISLSRLERAFAEIDAPPTDGRLTYAVP